MVGAPVLFAAEEDVSALRTVGGDEEFTEGVVEGDGDVGLGAGVHELGGGGGVPAKANDAFEVVEGDAEFGFAFEADGDGGSVFFEVGVFEGDEQSVEMSFHGFMNAELGSRNAELYWERACGFLTAKYSKYAKLGLGCVILVANFNR